MSEQLAIIQLIKSKRNIICVFLDMKEKAWNAIDNLTWY